VFSVAQEPNLFPVERLNANPPHPPETAFLPIQMNVNKQFPQSTSQVPSSPVPQPPMQMINPNGTMNGSPHSLSHIPYMMTTGCQCRFSYHNQLAKRWSTGQIDGFDLVIYCHLRHEDCCCLPTYFQQNYTNLERELGRRFLQVFRTFSQQWRVVRAYAFGRFWQVKTGGLEFLRTVQLIISGNELNQYFVNLNQIITKTLDWNKGIPEDPSPYTDCDIYDNSSLTACFEKKHSNVSLIKFVYYAYLLDLKSKSISFSLLRSLFEKLMNFYTIRDVWLVLGYHLAGCFWGDQEGCVGYLEYFTHCLQMLKVDDEPLLQKRFSLMSLLHGICYQNRHVIGKTLRENFQQNFGLMTSAIDEFCLWKEREEGIEILEKRNMCRNALRKIILPMFENHSLLEYGSTRLELDEPCSDLDMVILPYKVHSDNSVTSIHPIQECGNAGLKAVEREQAIDTITRVQKQLINQGEFSEIRIFTTRVPLIRAVYLNSITVDISGHSNESLFDNIQALHELITSEPALQNFLVSVKVWAKEFDLVRPYHGLMNSHGWTMMACFTWKLLSDDSKMRGVTTGEFFVKFFRLFRDFKYQTQALRWKDAMFVPKQKQVSLSDCNF